MKSLLVAALLAASPAAKEPAPVAVQKLPKPRGAFVRRELTDLTPFLRARLWTEARLAARNHRVPVLYVHAAWCEPCLLLQGSLDTPLMKDAFAGIQLSMVDYDRYDPWLAESGFVANSIPKFFELDHRGRPTGRVIDGGAWDDNVPALMAPPLKRFFQSRE